MVEFSSGAVAQMNRGQIDLPEQVARLRPNPIRKCVAPLVAVLICGSLCELSAQDKDVRSLASGFADSLSKASKKTVAVVDFTDLQGNVTELGRYLAEEMSVALAMTDKGLQVVDRTHLKALIQEHKLDSSGLIDPATARRLGQIAGVDVLVTGTLTPFGDSVRLAVKALDTTSARIVSASTTDIARTKAIEELLARGINPAPSGGSGTAPPSLQITQGVPRTIQKTAAENYTFELQSCEMSGTSVTCNLLVTNTKEDRDLVIAGNIANYMDPLISRMFDEFGGTYQAESVGFGNQVPGHGGVYRFVSGVPTPVTISFDDVAVRTGRLALLDIHCVLGATTFYGRFSGKKFQVQFRNIPVVK